jgi:hypothetical protein
MVKAYDLKDLEARLKASGMSDIEDLAKVIVQQTFAWIGDSAKLSATPYDDMAMFVLPKIEEMILSAADKIDGEVG